MPIRPENRGLYPSDWKAISHRIRFVRADSRCECAGECGRDHGGRCPAYHGLPAPASGKTVVLTVAHLDRQLVNHGDDNLKAMCQACHLSYDMDTHVANRAAARRSVVESTMDGLFDVGGAS